jgi:hypothetical protein
LLLDGVDLTKDFVKVFKLKTPPPNVIPPPPPATGKNIIFNFVGNAGTKHDAFNLVEVYQRPPIIASFTKPPAVDTSKEPRSPGYITDAGVQTTYVAYGVDERGALRHGSYATGKTGWWWEEHACDEFNDRFGSNSEGWIPGFVHGVQDSLWNYPGPLTTSKSMGFGWWGNGTTPNATHKKHYSGRVEPYFLGSVWFGGTGDPHAANRAAVNTRSAKAGVSGAWVQQTSNDGRLNAPGEQFKLTVPDDQGPLWIRMRTDKIDATRGYDWKAVTIYEWFVFNPATNYKKDINGNVIVDVYPYSTPYMSYRK